MRITAVILATTILLFSSPLWAAPSGTKARIDEKGGNWELDKGASHGVNVGMEGFFKKKTYSSKQRKFIEQKVAHFKVHRVFRSFSYAKVDRWNEGFSAKDARWAEFSRKLVPPKSSTKKTRPQKKQPVIATGKSLRWYLDNGDKAFEQSKFDLALDYYYQALEKNPDDPGATVRIKNTKGKYFVQQGELDYNNKDYLSAFEYYIRAFQELGEDNYIAAEKILDLWKQNHEFYERTKEYETSPGAILESLVTYCSTLDGSKEKELTRISTLAQEMKQLVQGKEIVDKVDTLVSVWGIQADITAGNFIKLLTTGENALAAGNLYQTAYIIGKLDKLELDEQNSARLAELKMNLEAKETQLAFQEAAEQKAAKIKHLETEAATYVSLKKYDEAISRYLEIFKMDPDNPTYEKKIKQLQLEKFQYEKFQENLKAKVEMESLILRAEDYFTKELMQDALDYYVRAYKVFPEGEESVAGVTKVLEVCNAADAKFLSGDLLGRKLSKFTSDFLAYVEKEYLDSKDGKGFEILSKVTFITSNPGFDKLLNKFKSNLYMTNLRLGNEQFEKANFDKASGYFQTAKEMMDTRDIQQLIRVCDRLVEIQQLLEAGNMKELKGIFKMLENDPDRFKVLDGLLFLSDTYLDRLDFKKGKYLFKQVADFNSDKHEKKIKELKQKLKELKKKHK